MQPVGYVTLVEADDYVKTHFLSTDPVRVRWEALAEDDRVVLLIKAFDSIELLPFPGRKTCWEQPNVFPKYPNKTVPKAIASAQVELALELSNTDSAEDQRLYERLWKYGVQSYSIGKLSESLSSGSFGAQATGIASSTALRLLKPFLGGGYSIV